MNFIFRDSTPKDATNIANLHTKNWQTFYRGILSNEYLDKKAQGERLLIWQKRFDVPNEKQKIILVEQDGKFCGFSCTFLDADPKWGALLDNLHVAQEWQGNGLGKQLIQQSMNWVKTQRPLSIFYLWVYKKNLAAIDVYEHLGAKNEEAVEMTNPDGGKAVAYRMVWEKLDT